MGRLLCGSSWFCMVAYGEVVCGVDFSAVVDCLCVVAYGMVVSTLDFNVEVDGLFVVAYGG